MTALDCYPKYTHKRRSHLHTHIGELHQVCCATNTLPHKHYGLLRSLLSKHPNDTVTLSIPLEMNLYK